MQTRADRLADELLDARLERGPADFVAIRRAFQAAGAGFWQPEGLLHVYLQGRVARGEIVHGAPRAGGLVVYAKRAAQLPTDEVQPPAPTPLPPERSKMALQVVKGVKDPAARGRALADVLAHLALLADGGKDAPRRGLKAFGSPRSIGANLARSARGKRQPVFKQTLGDHVLALVMREGPWILGALVMFFVIKLWVADVFWIPSSSMRPTLEKDDRVIALKLGADKPPERHAITTYERGARTYVKRLIAFGGELVAIYRGDVLINGRILVKPDDLRAALRFPRWNWTFDAAGAHRDWAERADAGGTWRLQPDLQASLWSDIWYAGRRGPMQRERRIHVHDGYLTLDADRPAEGEVVLVLTRRPVAGAVPLGDFPQRPLTFRLTVGPGGTVLTQHAEGEASRVLARGPASAAGALRLTLSVVDGVLRAGAPGFAFDRGLAGDGLPSLLPLVPGFAVSGGARATALALDQDLHYGYGYVDRSLPSNWVHGVPTAQDLLEGNPATWAWKVPAGQVYMLGDNTNDSSDSRVQNVGGIPVGDIIAPVVFRIWPPSRIGAME